MSFAATGPDLKTLVEMHCHRRPAGSKTERRFIRDYILPLGVELDAMGNLSKRIGRAPVLWSCHTDTVHRDGGLQEIAIKGGLLKLKNPNGSNCLGADDSAGIWLMREMILAQRPGLYIFHRSEEHGGLGSRFIAEDLPNTLCGIQYAIAFDRRGTDSVITHQGWGRCCSDAFARELAGRLGGKYRPDDTGVFTDTANYVDLVPECTNLSVGYSGEHSKNEMLDVDHLVALRDTLLKLETDGLPAERKPGEPDPYDDIFDHWGDSPYGANSQQLRPDLVQMIKRNPEEVADALTDYGITADELADEIYRRGGVVPF